MSAPATPTTDPDGGGNGVRIGRFLGVPIYVAPTWFLVAALITWYFAGTVERTVPELGPWRYAVSLSFAVLLYASVLIHELSHTVVALRAGLPVRRISLYLLGGVSEIEKSAPRPGVEAAIAVAGPAVSLLLGGLGLLVGSFLEGGTVAYLLVAALMWSNFVVGIFNLLPGLPLDGGRVLSAAVWKVTGRPYTGAIVASWAGRVLAVLVFALPLLRAATADASPNIVDLVWGALLASFIWVGATQSLHIAKLQRRIPSLSARNLTRPALLVQADMPLAEALRQAGEAQLGAVVVVNAEGEPIAVVNGAAVSATPQERHPWVPVRDVARQLEAANIVSSELVGEDLINALTSLPAQEYVVMDPHGRLVGVLVTRDVERAVAS